MQPHPSVAASRPLPLGSGPRCRRIGGCPLGLLLGLWAALAAGAQPDEAERAAAFSAAPILRVATVPESPDERPDAERARRAARELPPRLVPEPMVPPTAALASARTQAPASPADDPLRRKDVPVGATDARDGVQGVEQRSAREAGRESAGVTARPAVAGIDDAPPRLHTMATRHAGGPPRWPLAGSDERVPAVRAAASSGLEDPDVAEERDDEPAAASRESGTEVATQRDDGSPREARAETLSIVVGGFLPRAAAARGGREGRVGESSRPGLARPSGLRAGAGLPRESSDRGEQLSRDWKLERGRWGLEHGGRLNMELDSGYRLSLKPRRNGLVLSVRRNF